MDNKPTFFFYDLETSGIDPRRQRIMQFAGIRTDMDLNPVGEPLNILVALSDDVLPEPPAVMITGITPQKTAEEGYSEADFLRLLNEQVFMPGTTVVGFNNVRFDDEFLRYTLYRNFHDPYEWSWAEGRSRWDMLDVVRMTRALRPHGIEWPVDADGHPTNRLELLTHENGLAHEKAHDALSDVEALIDVARLLKQNQPKLFDYLFGMRDKKEVAKLVNLDEPQPFIYSSGRYPKGFLHTTAAFPVAPGSKPGSVIVYDLRHDPSLWADKSIKELKDLRFANYEARQAEGFIPLPAKELSYNKCPAVAPLGVLDASAQVRIVLDIKTIEENLAKLRRSDLGDKLREVFARDSEFNKSDDVDAKLYDGFVGDRDKTHMRAVRNADRQELVDFNPAFSDERLSKLLTRYKARNFGQSLNPTEREEWEIYRAERIQKDLPGFAAQLKKLVEIHKNDSKKLFLLGELQLWAESIAPVTD